MPADLWLLFENMLRSRLFEEAAARLWHEGRISGEMHLSIGEAAIVAGTVLQLQEGDAMALDHRGTSPRVMRGVDMGLPLREFMGLKVFCLFYLWWERHTAPALRERYRRSQIRHLKSKIFNYKYAEDNGTISWQELSS
jgi:hypothetical protein